MLTTQKLLEAARANNPGIPSFYRLARVLGVSDNTLTNWRTGKSRPADEHAAKLAELAGLDEGEVVASIRAERETDPHMRNLWASVAKRLHKAGATALAVILSLWIGGGPDGSAMAATPGAQAQTAPVDSAGSGNAHCRDWLLKTIARICRLLPPLIPALQPA